MLARLRVYSQRPDILSEAAPSELYPSDFCMIQLAGASFLGPSRPRSICAARDRTILSCFDFLPAFAAALMRV
ncbi:MAG: hypothetical protein DME65_04015 [Verrucomicrobia bacterium]|nr:MAG: hypothetical protein DME65_04015 [Verrucomicrobiota bacterium]